MKKAFLIILPILLMFFAGCDVESSGQNAKFSDITADFAYDMIQDKDVIILDVRTDEEYALGHVQDSVNIDYYNPNFKNLLNEFEKDKTYVVYSRSERRSGETLDMMKDLGFAQAYNIEGGINSWQKKGLTLIK